MTNKTEQVNEVEEVIELIDFTQDGQTERRLLSEALRALCTTYDYVGGDAMPAEDGWDWYEVGVKIVDLIGDDEWAGEFRRRVNRYKSERIRTKFKKGDWVFGIGENKGCSMVFEGTYYDLQPFQYLNDFDPDNFRLATNSEIAIAKGAMENEPADKLKDYINNGDQFDISRVHLGSFNILVFRHTVSNRLFFIGTQCAGMLEYDDIDQFECSDEHKTELEYEDCRRLVGLVSKEVYNFSTANPTIFISEYGLYSLILNSNLDDVFKLQSEVMDMLKEIRRNGE